MMRALSAHRSSPWDVKTSEEISVSRKTFGVDAEYGLWLQIVMRRTSAPVTHLVTWGHLLQFSEALYSHLQNGENMMCVTGLLWEWNEIMKMKKHRAWQIVRHGSPYLKVLTTVSFRKAPSRVQSPLNTRQHTNIALPQWRLLVSCAAWGLRIALAILVFYEFCQSKPPFSKGISTVFAFLLMLVEQGVRRMQTTSPWIWTYT